MMLTSAVGGASPAQASLTAQALQAKVGGPEWRRRMKPLDDASVRKELGKRLRELREERGLPQTELAAQMSPTASRSTVQRWESGQSAPTADQLVQLFVILRADPEAFFVGLSAELSEAIYKSRHARWFSVPVDDDLGGIQERVVQLEQLCEYTLEAQRQFDTMFMLPEVARHYYHFVWTIGGRQTGPIEDQLPRFKEINGARLAQLALPRPRQPPSSWLPGSVRRFNAVYSSVELLSFTLGAGFWHGIDVDLRIAQLESLLRTVRENEWISICWIPHVPSQFGVFGETVLILHENSFELVTNASAAKLYQEEYSTLVKKAHTLSQHRFTWQELEEREGIRSIEEAAALVPIIRSINLLKQLAGSGGEAAQFRRMAEAASRITASLTGTSVLHSRRTGSGNEAE